MTAPPDPAPKRRKWQASLAFRLVMTAMIWSALALIIAGVVLTEIYRASLIRSFDARLIVYEKTLAGLIASGDGAMPAPTSLSEPRFGLPLTGWYWMIRDRANGTAIATSQSLYGEILDSPPAPVDGNIISFDVSGPAGARLRVVQQSIDLGGKSSYDIVVTGNPVELDADIATFQLSVFITLLIFAAGLLLATILQVRIGLRPLDAMRAQLAAIRSGRSTRLDTDFPREIAPLGLELNALIEANEAIVERSRAHVGNLAHGLKTPMSVILNEVREEKTPLGDKVREQLVRMRGQIDHYLDQARMASQRRRAGSTGDVVKVVEGIAGVLRRAYLDKAVVIEVSGEECEIRIDRRDLEELLGNLMDNACKFGRGRVVVRLSLQGGARPMAILTVDDNGKGLPREKHAEVLGRGRRLDESVPGSGLGLSIVSDIVEAYGGQLQLGSSDLGGLKVTVWLPAV